MDIKRLITLLDNIKSSNGTTKMDEMDFINDVNEMCVMVELLINEYMFSKGESFPYKWMDINATEWAKEDFKAEDEAFIGRLLDIFKDYEKET
jgi:hypothetical protein